MGMFDWLYPQSDPTAGQPLPPLQPLQGISPSQMPNGGFWDGSQGAGLGDNFNWKTLLGYLGAGIAGGGGNGSAALINNYTQALRDKPLLQQRQQATNALNASFIDAQRYNPQTGMPDTKVLAPLLVDAINSGADVSPVFEVLKLMQKQQNEFGTNPTAGINPKTGLPDQFVTSKDGSIKWIGAAPAPKPGEPYTIGNTRFGADNKPVAQAPGSELVPPDQAEKLGFPKGSVVEKKADGSYNAVYKPPEAQPAVSPGRFQQEVDLKNVVPATQLSPEAIDNAAQYYIETGHYPGTMRDKASVAAVQNRIAELKPKDIPADQWATGLANNAIAYNSRKMTAAATGKQQALTTVNEDTVNGSINILDGLLKKGVASNLPFTAANDALQWMSRQTNDPDAANLKNAVGAISNEYARVMTGTTNGSSASDSARNEAASRLLLGMKEGTMRAVAGQMQREMKVRSDSYLNAMNKLTGGQYSGVTATPVTPIDQTPTGPSAPDKDGWVTMPNGIRIREKK